MSQDRNIKWLNDRRVNYRRDPITDKPTICLLYTSPSPRDS